MISLKNKPAIKTIFLSLIFASFATEALAVTNYVVNSTQGARVDLSNADSLTVTSNGALLNGNAGVLINGSSANFISNSGCIYSDSIGSNNCTTIASNVKNDRNTILIEHNAKLGTLTNELTGIIGRSIGILDNSSVGNINNKGLIDEDINLYQGSQAGTISNSGTVGDDIDIVDGSKVDTITNSGAIQNRIIIHDNPTVSARGIIGTINNSGTIKNKIQIHEANVTTINNTGTISSSEYLTNALTDGILIQGSTIGTLNNSGNIVGDIFMQHDVHLDLGITVTDDITNPVESIVTNLNNSGNIGGINLHDGSQIANLANNSNGIIGATNLYNNSQITQLNNNCGASVSSVNLYDNSQVPTLNNESAIGQILVHNSAKITDLNNNSANCGSIAQINLINLDGIAQIATVNNDAAIQEIKLDAGSSINTVNNNSGAALNEIDLSNDSKITTLNNDSAINTINVFDNAQITSLNNNSVIHAANLYGNSAINDLNNSSSATLDALNLVNNAQILHSLNNDNIIGQINLNDTSNIAALNNNCGAQITAVNLFNNSGIAALNNNGVISQIALRDSAKITQLNNNKDSNCPIKATLALIDIDGIAQIATLNNDSDINEIDLNNGGIIGNLNNNSDGNITTVNLDNNSTITALNNSGNLDNVNLDHNSTITTLNNDSKIDKINVNNRSDIHEMNLNNGAVVNELNNNSGTVETANLNQNSKIVAVNNNSTINEVNLRDSSQITNFTNNSQTGAINIYGNSAIAILNNDFNIDAINLYNDAEINDLNNKSDATLGELNMADNSQIVTPVDNYGLIGQINLAGTANIPQLNNHCGAQINGIALSNNSTIPTINNDAIIGQIAINDSAQITTLNNNINCGSPASIASIDLNGTAQLTTINNDSTIGQINLDNGANIQNINNNPTGTIASVALANGSQVTLLNNLGIIKNDDGTAIASDATSNINISNTSLISGNGKSIDYGNGAHNLLTLNPGSTITGIIDFGNQNSNEVTVTGGYQATRYYYYNGDFKLNPYDTDHIIVIITKENDQPVFIVTNKPEVPKTPDTAVNSSNDINNVISARLDGFRLHSQNCENNLHENRCIQRQLYGELYASNDDGSRSDASNSGSKFGEQQTLFWSEVFGSYQERDSYKASGESENSTGGLIFGADKKLNAEQRLGGFLGVLNGSSDIFTKYSSNLAVNIDSKGLFVGGYLSKNIETNFIDFSLITGLIENNSNRLVSDGVAQSSYNNIFFTPSVTFGQASTLPKLDLPVVTSIALRYTGQFVGGDTETGSSEDITTHDKYLNTVSTRLKLETNNKGSILAGGNFNINFRTGLEANKIIGNQKVDITILGQDVSLVSNNRNYNIDGFVGVNTSYDLQENVRIYADVEGSKGISKSLSGNNLGLYGKLGLKWGF